MFVVKMLKSWHTFIILYFLKCLNFTICIEDVSVTMTGNSTVCDDQSLNTNDALLDLIRSEGRGRVAGRESREMKPLNATAFLDEMFGERLFNTTMNFIVPGAKINLPRHTNEGNVDHLAMQAFFGIFWAIAWVTTLVVPWTTFYLQPFGIGRSIDETGFNIKWKLNEKLGEQAGLKWKPCLKKTICQAHEFPKKYGVLGTTIQFLFPFTKDSNNLRYDKSDELGEAAVIGATEKNCDDTYKCFFDVLDVLLYIGRYFTDLPT